MSLYSAYDAFYSDNPSPVVLGGKNRAIKAKRDELGRFMPDNEFLQEFWELDPQHGVAGGKKRASTAKRINGKFAKD